jgi:hypothetical protein
MHLKHQKQHASGKPMQHSERSACNISEHSLATFRTYICDICVRSLQHMQHLVRFLQHSEHTLSTFRTYTCDIRVRPLCWRCKTVLKFTASLRVTWYLFHQGGSSLDLSIQGSEANH